jgi:lipoyl(octanoyl) transferase
VTPGADCSESPEGAGSPGPSFEVRDLGRMGFQDTYRLQQELLRARIEGRVGDQLLLVEHDAVVTRGRRSPEGDTAAVPFPVATIERGGEATYHGPGQLVAYPILRLDEGQRDLRAYLRWLEGVVIEALARVGVEGRREEGYTGVWIGDRKACSIGVAVRGWVAWHGLAVNVTTDLAAYGSFSPCGLSADIMTRVADHLPEAERDPEELMVRFKEALLAAFATAGMPVARS